MQIIELIHVLKSQGSNNITDIDIEDYKGNTIFKLSNLDLADIEDKTMRLQSNLKEEELTKNKQQKIQETIFKHKFLPGEIVYAVVESEIEINKELIRIEKVQIGNIVLDLFEHDLVKDIQKRITYYAGPPDMSHTGSEYEERCLFKTKEEALKEIQEIIKCL